MWPLKNRFRGFYLWFALLLTLTIGGSALTYAYADSGGATATVKGGSLTESNATKQVRLSLTSSKQVRVVSYSLPITVIDARGLGAGWNLMITSTQFVHKDAKKHVDQLPANASRIVGVGVSCGTNSTCTSPTDSVSYPVLVPAGNTPPPSVKFFNAAVSSGLGKFSLTMMVNVTVPAHTENGTYTATIILSVANGP